MRPKQGTKIKILTGHHAGKTAYAHFYYYGSRDKYIAYSFRVKV